MFEDPSLSAAAAAAACCDQSVWGVGAMYVHTVRELCVMYTDILCVLAVCVIQYVCVI